MNICYCSLYKFEFIFSPMVTKRVIRVVNEEQKWIKYSLFYKIRLLGQYILSLVNLHNVRAPSQHNIAYVTISSSGFKPKFVKNRLCFLKL